jgi:ParB/RepB/Spo0J family partition protein
MAEEKKKKKRKLFISEEEEAAKNRISPGGTIDAGETVKKPATPPAPGTKREERMDTMPAVRLHEWKKANLVTRPDGSDLWRCENCQEEFKRFGLVDLPATHCAKAPPELTQREREAMADFDVLTPEEEAEMSKAPGSQMIDAVVVSTTGVKVAPSFEQQMAAQMGIKTPARAEAEQARAMLEGEFPRSRIEPARTSGGEGVIVNPTEKPRGVPGKALPAGPLPTPKPPKRDGLIHNTGSLMIPIGEIRESPFNVRRTWGDLPGLARSLERDGQLQNLGVRQVAGQAGWELVYGHRRLRAGKIAGMSLMRCEPVLLDDIDVERLQLIENIQREALDPIEEATGLKRQLDHDEKKAATLAQELGKSKRWVYGRVKLLELAPELRKQVSDGALNTTVGEVLAAVCSDQGLQLKAWRHLSAGGLATREALHYLREEFCKPLRGAPFDQKDPLLVPEMGPCGKCQYRSGNTPGLFDADSPDLCLKTSCFREKSEATWKERAGKAKEKGATVLGVVEGRALFRTDHLGGGYVAANAPNPLHPKRWTWKQIVNAIADQSPTGRAACPDLVVAPDDELRSHELFKESEVIAAAEKAGMAWAKKVVEREKVTKPAPEKAKEQELQRLGRELTQSAVIEAIAREVGTGAKFERPDLEFMALAFIGAENNAGALAGMLERRQLDGPGKPDRWVKKATVQELVGFLFEVALVTAIADPWLGFDPKLKKLAGHYGVSFGEIEKAQNLAAHRELDPEKPKKKGKAA